MVLGKTGFNIAQKIGHWLARLWVPILSCTGVYVLLIVQELYAIGVESDNVRDIQALRRKEGQFANDVEYLKAKRNLTLVVFGVIAQIGLLLIARQTEVWKNRNDGLRRRIAIAEMERSRHEEHEKQEQDED